MPYSSRTSQLALWDRDEEEVVVKANQLVMGQIDWSLWEYRVFVAHVAQIKKEDTGFEKQRVHVRELRDMTKTTSQNLYERGKDLADRLTDKKIRIEDVREKGKRRYGAINVYASCVYEEAEGAIVGRFTEEMRPFLLQLRKQFTMYYKRHALALSSLYAIRLYEIIKRYEYRGQFQLTVDEIRTIFNLKDKYRRFCDLKRRVIDQAKSEIDDQADVTFEYEVIREGRSPVAVDFSIRPNGNTSPPPSNMSQSVTSSQLKPRHQPGGPRDDSVDVAFGELSDQEQGAITATAEKLARDQNPDAGTAVIRAETWKHVRRIVKEEHLHDEPNQ